MGDATLGFDEDPIVDKLMDMDQRVVGINTVYVTKVIGVDGVLNQKWHINSNGSLDVTVVSDTSGRGLNGDAPASVAVGGSSTSVLSSSTTRRSVILSNPSVVGGATIWVRPGGAAAAVGRGVPIFPGGIVVFDKSPNAAFTAISDGASVNVGIGLELD